VSSALRAATLSAFVVGSGSAFTLRASENEVKRERADFGEVIIIGRSSAVINGAALRSRAAARQARAASISSVRW
jgi:hypothetical protein